MRIHQFGMVGLLALSGMCVAAPASASVDVNVHLPGVRIDIGAPPPPVRHEVIPAPRRGYVWQEGYWYWNGRRHVWAPGAWIAVRPGYLWAPARWVPDGPRWRFEPGRWDRDPEWRPEPRRERHDHGRRGHDHWDRDDHPPHRR